jgi:crotonobetainyl-CoA:carnitine CoA-transferase CaiB-like acyl-CoA transferase
MLSGPYGSMILADLGAEVIKIEEPEKGDGTRSLGQYYLEGESAYFISINRNKKSITLNLKTEEGREVFYKLVEKSDVVFDNFRPGIVEKLKVDYDTLKKINPGIICSSVSGFGQNGPYRDRPAFDLVLQAIGGAMSITGEPEGAPVRMGIPTGDLAGGMFAAHGVMAALYNREKTGVGCRIDVGLLDSQVSMLTYVAEYVMCGGEIPKPIGSGHQSVVPYQAFKTGDIYIVIAVFVEKFWHLLCDVMDLKELENDPRFESNDKRRENRDELIPLLQEQLLTRPGDEWLKLLAEAGVPSGPINSIDRVLKDPQLLARNMVPEVEHPTCGPVSMLGNPIKITDIPETFLPPPTLGLHTEEILTGLAGLSSEQIKDLKDKNVI